MIVAVIALLALPPGTVGEAMQLADHLAIVRTTGHPARRIGGAEILVQVELADAIDRAPSMPGRFTISFGADSPHELELLRIPPKTLLLAPLRISLDGGLLYLPRRPLLVAERSRRAVVDFAQRWHAARDDRPEARLPEWLGLLLHPAPAARSAALDALRGYRKLLETEITDEQLDDLGKRLTDPGRPPGTGAAILDALGIIGGERAITLVAQRFALLTPKRLQHKAADYLGRWPTKDSRRALTRCADSGWPELAMQCRRVLARVAARKR